MNVLITGANRGIGLAFTRHYLGQGHHVFAVCRHVSDELRDSGADIIDGIDVSQARDVATLKQQLGDKRLDLLINNAGILASETLDNMDFDSIAEQLNVNAIAPLRVTHALLDNMGKSSKIALITSRMGSIADNGSGGYYGYRMSKAALNAAGKSLANDLKGRGIAVAILHPGMVSTRMIGFAGDVTPEQAVDGLTARIENLSLDNTGTFWHANGEELPW